VIDLCLSNSSHEDDKCENNNYNDNGGVMIEPNPQLLDPMKQTVIFFELDENDDKDVDDEVEIVFCKSKKGKDDSDTDDVEIVDPPPSEYKFVHNDQTLDTTIKQQKQLPRKESEDDDHDSVQVVATSMLTLPHMRQHCTVHPFSNRTNSDDAAKNNEITCDLCYCYVCDVPAKDCKEWSVHCQATDEILRWRVLRNDKKNGIHHSVTESTNTPKIIFEGRMKRGKRLDTILGMMYNFRFTQFHMIFEPTCISIREFDINGGVEFKLFHNAFLDFRCPHPSSIFVDNLGMVLSNLTDCRRKTDNLKIFVTDNCLRLEVEPTCSYRRNIVSVARSMQIREEQETNFSIAWNSSHLCKCDLPVNLFGSILRDLGSRYFDFFVFSSEDDILSKDKLLISAEGKDFNKEEIITRNKYCMRPSPRHVHTFRRVKNCPECQNAVQIEKVEYKFRFSLKAIDLEAIMDRARSISVGPFMEFRLTANHYLQLEFDLNHGAVKEGFFRVCMAQHVAN
jgi:hypothetical protein